jgi:hypothetical protein
MTFSKESSVKLECLLVLILALILDLMRFATEKIRSTVQLPTGKVKQRVYNLEAAGKISKLTLFKIS